MNQCGFNVVSFNFNCLKSFAKHQKPGSALNKQSNFFVTCNVLPDFPCALQRRLGHVIQRLVYHFMFKIQSLFTGCCFQVLQIAVLPFMDCIRGAFLKCSWVLLGNSKFWPWPVPAWQCTSLADTGGRKGGSAPTADDLNASGEPAEMLSRFRKNPDAEMLPGGVHHPPFASSSSPMRRPPAALWPSPCFLL